MSLLPEKLPDFVEKPVENVLTPVSENIGKTFSDLWFLALGGISHIADKKRIKYSIALEEYKKSIESKESQIPDENLTEPNTQVVCQALEDSKFCVENEEIREMFASLIASTMDNRTSDFVHPSFSSILKQMTPEDARFFKIFINKPEITLQSYKILDHHNCKEIIEYFYFDNSSYSTTNQHEYYSSLVISSLEKLGVILIERDPELFGHKFDCESELEPITINEIKKHYDTHYSSDGTKLEIHKGFARLTVLGSYLLAVCCPNEYKINE